jgi:hypothetical protein
MKIDEKISILNSKKPFPKYTQNSLEEDFKLRFIYYSNKYRRKYFEFS